MLVRGDSVDRAMSRYRVDRIEQHDRITARTATKVVGCDGRDRLESVAIAGPEGEQTLATDALFVLAARETLDLRAAASSRSQARLPLSRIGSSSAIGAGSALVTTSRSGVEKLR
jgi:hypothetical protein